MNINTDKAMSATQTMQVINALTIPARTKPEFKCTKHRLALIKEAVSRLDWWDTEFTETQSIEVEMGLYVATFDITRYLSGEWMNGATDHYGNRESPEFHITKVWYEVECFVVLDSDDDPVEHNFQLKDIENALNS